MEKLLLGSYTKAHHAVTLYCTVYICVLRIASFKSRNACMTCFNFPPRGSVCHTEAEIKDPQVSSEVFSEEWDGGPDNFKKHISTQGKYKQQTSP